MKWILPDVFLTILMELDPPTILPCIVHIIKMIFAIYSVSFWPSWSKICCCTGKKTAILVTVAEPEQYGPLCRQKSIKMAKLMGVQSQKYQKCTQKCQILGQILGQAHVLARYAGKKGQKTFLFFSPRTVTFLAWWRTQKKLDCGHSSQSYKQLKFWQKVSL